MAHYVVSSYDIVDNELYRSFPVRLLHLLVKHKGEIHQFDCSYDQQSGNMVHVEMIIRFPDSANLSNWFTDPQYAGIQEIISRSTKNLNSYVSNNNDRFFSRA